MASSTSLKNRQIRRLVVEARSRLDELEELLIDAWHSKDFRSIRWFGQSYSFSPAQAGIVRQLWDAWENGTPELGSETLLEGIASDANAVRDIFKAHPAWGTLIQSGKAKGTYQLVEPEA